MFPSYSYNLKLYLKINNFNNSKKPQPDLDCLAEWCNLNGMELNLSKCYLLVFSQSINPYQPIYTNNNSHLCIVSQIKNLGLNRCNS